jgi:two-component system response regulator
MPLHAILVRPVEILLVEDSPSDAAMVLAALGEKGRIANCPHVVQDGEEAMAFLRRRAPYRHAPRPDLMVLDLNLPRMDGHQVLRDVRADPDLREIPIVVLTTSANEVDVSTSYELGANAYVVKPIEYVDFLAAMRKIEDFWLQLVRLPHELHESPTHGHTSGPPSFRSDVRSAPL